MTYQNDTDASLEELKSLSVEVKIHDDVDK